MIDIIITALLLLYAFCVSTSIMAMVLKWEEIKKDFERKDIKTFLPYLAVVFLSILFYCVTITPIFLKSVFLRLYSLAKAGGKKDVLTSVKYDAGSETHRSDAEEPK